MRKNTGQFEKGKSGNPGGRPKKPEIQQLKDAIACVEKEKGKKLFVHFVEQAFEDRNVLTHLMRKILPDIKALEGSIGVDVGKNLMGLIAQAVNKKKNG